MEKLLNIHVNLDEILEFISCDFKAVANNESYMKRTTEIAVMHC